MRKQVSYVLLLAMACLQLAGCGKKQIAEEYDCETHITITNEVENQIKAVGVTYYSGENALGSIGMENADGSLLGKNDITFCITKDDIPAGADLSDFRIKIAVTDASGGSFDACELSCIPEFGKDYRFALKEEEGCYSLWPLFDGNEVKIGD